jgi:hypothetical protein
MADEIDRANEQAQMILDHELSYRKPVPNIKPNGLCHFCEDDLDRPGQLFCDDKCSMKYNRINSI